MAEWLLTTLRFVNKLLPACKSTVNLLQKLFTSLIASHLCIAIEKQQNHEHDYHHKNHRIYWHLSIYRANCSILIHIPSNKSNMKSLLELKITAILVKTYFLISVVAVDWTK